MKFALLQQPTKYLFPLRRSKGLLLEDTKPLLVETDDSSEDEETRIDKLTNIEVIALSPSDVEIVEEEREVIDEVDCCRRRQIDIISDEREVAQTVQEEPSETNKSPFGFLFETFLCFPYKNPVLEEEDETVEDVHPISTLFGGHMYKQTRDDPIGVAIKTSSKASGIFISKMSISSRLRSTAMLVGMRIVAINGLPCPKNIAAAAELIRSAQGDLRVIAAKEDDPIFASQQGEEDDDDAVDDEVDDESSMNGTEAPLECRRSTTLMSIVQKL